MQFFFGNCSHILTRTQEEKFEDLFLVKIASKGTSVRDVVQKIYTPATHFLHLNGHRTGHVTPYPLIFTIETQK